VRIVVCKNEASFDKYHQEGCVSSGRGVYHPEQESIIWIGEGVIYLREKSII
jgi:hypothetical protein